MENKFIAELITGTDEQNKVLYDFLLKRTFKISHKFMPDFDEHVKFILKIPIEVGFY